MGMPMEQQKYQSLGNLVFTLSESGPITEYRHALDLDTGIATTTYTQGDASFTREVFVTPVDQVIVVRLTSNRPRRISLRVPQCSLTAKRQHRSGMRPSRSETY